MSFTPLQFNYVPPPTVQTPVPSSTISTTSSTTQPNRALAAIQSLNDLIDTSAYLQDLIVAKYSNTGVKIDSNADPETARALAACYNGIIPPIVTTGMYNNLLDCQFALQSIDQAVGPNSSIEADPVMLANVTQINNAISSSLLNDGGSDQLAIQSLTFLKGDSSIFSNIATALLTYGNGTDLGTSTSLNLNTLISNEQSLLASMYSLQTQANVINQDINNVVNAYFYQPLEDVVRITAAINLLQSLNYKNEAKKIFDGLSTIVYSRLLSEVAPIYFAADQTVQRVLTPLKSMVGSMGSILNTVNSSVKTLETATNLAKTTASNVSQQGIKGFPNCNPCSQQVLKNISGSKLPNIPNFKGLSSGLQYLGQHINAAQNEITKQFSDIESAFIALQKRRNKDSSDILQLMCAMQAAESLVNIGKQVIGQSNSGIPPQISAAASTASLNSIINNLTTANTKSTSIPVPSTNVSSVLMKGAAGITGAVNG